MGASDSLRQKKIKFFCPILDTSTCLQAHVLFKYGKERNESEDISIYHGALRYQCNTEYLYSC